ncbi:MAG: M20/M25/M40 family metallo-hydrolase [Gemmatimonadaceae bacterium]
MLHTPRLDLRTIAALIASATVASTAAGQRPAPPHSRAPTPSESTTAAAATKAVASWLAFDAPPGEEFHLTDPILAADSRWRRDELGNLVMTVGSGHPRRLVACGLDHVGFVVSEITDQGYLRLHRAGNARTHALWDQFHEAQQVSVVTRNGNIPGVVAVTNAHFARQHRADTAVTSVDQLWVDVGARTRQEANGMGIQLLDPVARSVQPWLYSDYVAGADASGRSACAAVASVAHSTQNMRGAGETVFVLSVQRSFAWRGLQAAVAQLGAFDDATIVAPNESYAAHNDEAPVSWSRMPRSAAMLPNAGVDSIARLQVRARFAGSLVESVRAADLDSLLGAVQKAAGLRQSAVWLALRADAAQARAQGNDSLSTTASLLTTLVELPGVPGQEQPVRDAVRAALPEWARSQVKQDSAGNLILAMGPDRDTTVFLAHMDEVSYIVHSISGDGTVTLTPQGGLIPSAWEGQPALLYLDGSTERAGVVSPAPVAGVFVPRETATLRRPDTVRAWFGMDASALAARGVHAGLGVTAFKRGLRLGATRYTARALDDRAGVTALLLALQHISPSQLRHKLIFVWSVQEETGLIGAEAVARRIARSVHHAYAIDTFVSSDTPLESPHFAFAPLGAGAVLRGLDDGLIVLPSERARIVALAHAHGLPLQIGATQGSTDAVPFVARGALGAGISWPGRYSHSPAEVLDLNDLNTLVHLIDALAQ